MKITCCLGCVPPKKYLGCQDHCPDLNTLKILNIVEKAAYEQQKQIDCGLNESRARSVRKALKSSKRKWCE